MIGLKGSPTRVKKTFVPQKRKEGVVINGTDVTDTAEKLFAVLQEKELI